MNLVERYVYDVTRRLPESQRGDVHQELMAEIEAMIDDEAAGKKASKKQIFDVLMRMGSPEKLADQYLERKRYIIGPMYYGTYLTLLKMIMMIVIPVITFFTFTGRLATVNEHIVSAVFHTFGAGIEVAVHIFFWVTIVFMIIERKLQATNIDIETWTPDQLPKLPAKQIITKSDAMLGMTWSVIAIWATSMQIPEVHRVFAPDVPLFFTPAMWPYWTIALLTISVVSFGAEMMKLIVGGWTRSMVIVITIANLSLITFFMSLVALVRPVVNPEFTQLVSRLLEKPSIGGVETSVKIFVAVIVLISVYEIFIAIKSYMTGKKEKKV